MNPFQPLLDRVFGPQVIRSEIERLALDYHKTIEGEYGCPGLQCPGVQRLIEFGLACAATSRNRWELEPGLRAKLEMEGERDDDR